MRSVSHQRGRLADWLVKGLGLLLLLIALSFAFFRAQDRSLESLVARWAPPPSQFIELKVGDHVQLTHLRDEGPREDPLPILLLHGTADSLHCWDGWVAELSKTRRVLRADLPGFGLTGPAADADYRIAAYVQFVKALLDEQGVQRVLIAGNSLGGEVAWMSAAALQERVAGLVLVDPAGLHFEPETLPAGFAAAAFTPSAWMSKFLLPRPLVRASVAAVYADPSKISDAEVDRFFEMSLREGNRWALHQRVQAFLAERDGAQYTQAWAHLTQPVLLIWGEKDRLIPPAFAQAYVKGRAKEAPPVELKILPGLGHVPHSEDPAASLAAALPFIDTVH